MQQIFDHDYSGRWKPGRGPDYSRRPSRPLLSPLRSLGSVIKLLTPSDDYTPEYNAWLASFPDHIYPLVFLIKRYLPPQAPGSWRELLGVDSINGRPGHELKAMGRRLVGSYLRVGLLSSQGWRTFKLRQDFAPAVKVQTEDDITASVVVPADQLRHLPADARAGSYKFAVNCEYRLFQRPDDAVHRGLDRQTEADLARPDNFLSNFEPLTAEQARDLVDRVTEFDEFTAPMRGLLQAAAEAGSGTVVCSAYPRLVDGKPSKNPRYLQIRPDLLAPQVRYVAERGMRLARGITGREPLPVPVGAVLIGRRNNPPDRQAGIRPLAVYGPIHYQELPELFMDVICSLTGKSPSTTGRRLGGGADQGPVQRPADDRRPQRGPGVLHPHRAGGLQHGRGVRRPAPARRPRHQPAHPGDLVPAHRPGARPGVPDRRGAPGAAARLRARRPPGAGQPAGLPHHRQVRADLLRAGLRPSRPGLRRGLPAAGDPGPGGVRGRGPQHHRGPAAGRPAGLRGRLHRGRLPAAAGAAVDHGPRHVRGEGRPPPGRPAAVHPGGAPGQRLVPAAPRRQAARGRAAVAAARGRPGRLARRERRGTGPAGRRDAPPPGARRGPAATG